MHCGLVRLAKVATDRRDGHWSASAASSTKCSPSRGNDVAAASFGEAVGCPLAQSATAGRREREREERKTHLG